MKLTWNWFLTFLFSILFHVESTLAQNLYYDQKLVNVDYIPNVLHIWIIVNLKFMVPRICKCNRHGFTTCVEEAASQKNQDISSNQETKL
jgi:hypothetical protein